MPPADKSGEPSGGGGHMDWLEAVVLAAAAGTGFAAANRLLANPLFDVGVLLGMALGASLVILILRLRGPDVFVPPSSSSQAAAAADEPAAPSRPPREGSLVRGVGHSGDSQRGASTTSPGQRQHAQQQQQQQHHHAAPSANVTSPMPSPVGGSGGGGGAIGMLRRISSHGALGRDRSLNGSGSQAPGSGRRRTGSGRFAGDPRFEAALHDPRFKGVRLIDWNGLQIPFNEAVDFENEFFRGKVLFMLRTKPEDPRYVPHFAGKQRLFEMQIQGQFKKLPQGVLYMGAELTEKMHMGLVTKTVAGMILAFARRVLKNLHYSFGEKGDVANADEIELPHLTFPLSRGMDRLVITPPGAQPPPLGREFDESEELRVPRRGGRGEEPEFKLGPTYSMSFHSMYMDFPGWRLVNIAGQKSIDLASYFGESSSIHIVVYDLDVSAVSAAGGKHRKCDKRYFYHCELSNADAEREAAMMASTAASGLGGSLGVFVTGAGATPAGAAVRRDASVSVSGAPAGATVGGGAGDRGDGEEEEEEEEEGAEGGDAIEASAAGQEELLGSGVFVRSGDIVPLLAAVNDHQGNGNGSGSAAVEREQQWGCVTESKGYCIARPGAAPLDVHLIKVGGSSAYYRSDFLCNGDVVILRNSVNGKYLSVYKGWWLWWTPHPPSSSSASRAHFVVQGLEDEERLTVGRAFRLRSSKWSSYEVGISEAAASEYGGRMIGLYQTGRGRRISFMSRKSKTWLLPLQLKFQSPREAEEPAPAPPTVPLESQQQQPAAEATAEGGGGAAGPFFVEKALSPEDVEALLEVEVPAWIEMVHRRKRKPQLAYALRVRFKGKGADGGDVAWMALRTGIDLAPVIQMQRNRNGGGLAAGAGAAVVGAGDGGGGGSGEEYMLRTARGSKGKEGKGAGAGSSGGGGRGGTLRSQTTSLEDGTEPPTLAPTPSLLAAHPLQHQNPADQSVRLLSLMLDEITASSSSGSSNGGGPSGEVAVVSAASSPPYPEPPSCKAALYSLLRRRNYLDAWFLTGTAADLNVTVPLKQPVLQQGMAARALWESHWKEEWMVLYPSHIAFFGMGSRSKPSWSVFLHDVLSVKPPPPEPLRQQFPGKHFLALETLGRVHYLCFATEAIRDGWLAALASRVAQASYEMPVGVVISDPREAFVLKSGQWRPSSRLILNARRMSFDLPPTALAAVASATPSELSEKALRMVYDLSPDSGTERLATFLDLCSAFRAFPLHRLDPGSDQALAFWLNLHHTLLQHALLLLGPPSSKDWASFFAGVSYEIGADVFSLSEIEHCVMRGRLSRPRTTPRYHPSPPPADDDHYRYALSGPRADFRVNFALTTGSTSAPPFVTVFRAGPDLGAQLDRAAVRYLDYTLKLTDGSKKRMIVLPKVCDMYRRDFSPLERSMATVKALLLFMDRTKRERIGWALAGAKPPVIKYLSARARCHETLNLIEDRIPKSQQGQQHEPEEAAAHGSLDDSAALEASAAPSASLAPQSPRLQEEQENEEEQEMAVRGLASPATPPSSASASVSGEESASDEEEEEEDEEEEGSVEGVEEGLEEQEEGEREGGQEGMSEDDEAKEGDEDGPLAAP